MQGVAECALRNIGWPSVLTKEVTGIILIALAGLWGLLHATLTGSFDSYFIVSQDGQGQANEYMLLLPSQYASWLVSATTEAFFWITCGILSTAGLGSGVQVSFFPSFLQYLAAAVIKYTKRYCSNHSVHELTLHTSTGTNICIGLFALSIRKTGALILFPHCVGLAVEWVDSHESVDAKASFAELMWNVAIPGFWSGTGSAVGELLPYVLAKMIKAAGGDPFSLLEEPDIPDPRSLEFDEAGQSKQKKKSLMSVLVANTRSAMEGQLLESKWTAFLKLFILAAVPNGLFDLCGLVCGAAGVSFCLFFGAVWTGKALVRTPLQTCGLAAAVALCSNSNLTEDSTGGTDEDDSSIRVMALKLAKDVVSAIVYNRAIDETATATTSDGVGQASTAALFVSGIKTAWTCASFGLLSFFCLSTIEQVAQHHAKQRKGL